MLEDMLDLSKVQTQQTNITVQSNSDDEDDEDDIEQRENEISIMARDGHLLEAP